MFDKVIVTGDLLRPFFVSPGGWESSTWKNIRWLSSLLSPALSASGREVKMVSWDPHMDPRHGFYFDTPSLYAQADQPLSVEGWARLAGPTADIPPAAWDGLLKQCENALLIGYEMPDAMISVLTRAGVSFIDVVLHPVRFLDDLVFALRTNVPAFHAVFVDQAIQEDAIYQKAALIQAKAAWMKKPLQTPPGSVLLLGQVEHDRSLLRADGGFSCFADFLPRLHQLCCEHPKLLFKPHPYDAKTSQPRRLFNHLAAISRIGGNFYHLIAQPEIEKVVALNSSCLIEARYFGKQAEGLIPPLYAFGTRAPDETGQPGEAVAQNGCWIDPWFWGCLLDGTPAPEHRIAPPANRLRRTMNADWGYGFIEQVVA